MGRHLLLFISLLYTTGCASKSILLNHPNLVSIYFENKIQKLEKKASPTKIEKRKILKLTLLDELESFKSIIKDMKPPLASAETAAPAIPSLGKPNHPRINPPERMTCIPELMLINIAG